MKKILITLLLFSCITTNAQFDGFVELSIDPKMAIEGPYKDKPQDTNGGSLNFEISSGFEWDKERLGFSYESHKKINYEKFAVFFDWKFNNKILVFNVNGFTTHTGFEGGLIKRKWPNNNNNQYNYRDVTISWPLYGFNLGLYYNIKYQRNDTGFYLGLKWNIFRGEEVYQKYQKTYIDQFRNDGMISLVRKF